MTSSHPTSDTGCKGRRCIVERMVDQWVSTRDSVTECPIREGRGCQAFAPVSKSISEAESGNGSRAASTKPAGCRLVRMIEDRRLLTAERPPHPNGLRHRNQELQALRTAFGPLTMGQSADGAFVHGPSGVGKTASARYLLEDLRDEHPRVRTIYVDAWDLRTRAAVLRAILADATDAEPSVWRGAGIDELVRAIGTLDGPLVVVLDEADRLDEPAACRDLIEADQIAPVVIANSHDQFLARLDERVRSRLARLRAVRFDPYSVDELVSILGDRVGVGVRPDAVDSEILERIADHAAGDAREAIAILYQALLVATERDADRVRPEFVDAAVAPARESIVEDVLASLREDQLQLVETLADVGPARTGQVRSAMLDRFGSAPCERTLRNWFSKLREYEVVRIDQSGRYRRYGLTESAQAVFGER